MANNDDANSAKSMDAALNLGRSDAYKKATPQEAKKMLKDLAKEQAAIRKSGGSGGRRSGRGR